MTDPLSDATSPFESPVPGMDPVAVARWAQRSAQSSPWLHEEVGTRMAQRLGWIKAKPASWLSWEPVLAGIETHRTVATTYPQAQVLVLTCRPAETLDALKTAASRGAGFWTRMRYNPPLLVGTESQVDMVWANMALHQTHLPLTLLAKWHRSLRVDGFLMFSCLGPDSLKELRCAYQQLGWAEPCHAHTDMHDWGDMLVQTGFAEPVMDMERITLSYSSAAALLQDLRAWGRNLSTQRCSDTKGKGWRDVLCGELERYMPRTDDGRLSLTFEVVYGHAHKGRSRIPLAADSRVALQDMRQMLAGSASRSR